MILTVILAVALIGTLGFVYWQNFLKPKDAVSKVEEKPKVNIDNTSKDKTPVVDPNKGFLVLDDWGVRLKVPSSLTDVRYYISDANTVAYFVAIPTGADVKYVNNIADESVYKIGALGTLIRSTDSTKPRVGGITNGKKLGNYYYYTAWSFSGLSSGVGIMGSIYGWDGVSTNDPRVGIASNAFKLVNDEFLNTIELKK